MAQTPFTGLLTGSSTPFLASGDVVAFVDVSDTTQSPSGSLVKGTLTQFFAAVPAPVNITSASATAFAVGLNGATNSAFVVDASTGSQAAGLKVTGAVAAGTVAVAVISSGADANVTLNAKGTGTIGIGSVSTGRVTITPVTTITGALTLSAALTYGGVTLSNAVTGTGNMVLSASPTFTGTAVAATLNATTLGGTLSTATQNSVTTMTGLTTIGTLVAGAVPASLVTAGTLGSGNFTLSGTAILTATTVTATNLGGTLSTAAQPNVTSVGTLTSLAVTNTADTNTVTISPTHATYTGSAVRIAASRAASAAYYMIYADANSVAQFTVTGAGVGMFAGALSIVGALTGVTTLATSGLHTASGGILINGGTGGTGRIVKDATTGLQIRGIAGSGYDFEVMNAAGSTAFAVPTATSNVTFFGGITATTGTFTGLLQTTVTTEQMRLRYDASNYASFTVDSGGDLTIAPSGADTNITGRLNLSAAGQLTKAGEGTAATVKFGGVAGEPAVMNNGDMWFNTSSGNIQVRIGGATYTLTKT